MSLTTAQSQLLINKFLRKHPGKKWDRANLSSLLHEMETREPAKPKPQAPQTLVAALLASGSGLDRAVASKAERVGRDERRERSERGRVRKQHTTAAARAASTTRPGTAGAPERSSRARCRSCSRSPSPCCDGAVAPLSPVSPVSTTHPAASAKSIHAHPFVVGISDCRPDACIGIAHARANRSRSRSPPSRSPERSQRRAAEQRELEHQAQTSAWLDPAQGRHVSAATLAHLQHKQAETRPHTATAARDQAQAPQQTKPKPKRKSKGIQPMEPLAAEQAQTDTQTGGADPRARAAERDLSALPPAGLPTAVSSAREGARVFIGPPRAGVVPSYTLPPPTDAASCPRPTTSNSAYGAAVLSPRRSSTGAVVPQPALPLRSAHNAASFNVFAHDDGAAAPAGAGAAGAQCYSYRELSERIKHQQYSSSAAAAAAAAAPHPSASAAPAAGIRSAVEPAYAPVPAASARPATAPAPINPAHAAWEAERVALLRELTAAQLRENAAQADQNARRARPEGAVAWWPDESAQAAAAAAGAEEARMDVSAVERLRAQKQQLADMQAWAALARVREDRAADAAAAVERRAQHLQPSPQMSVAFSASPPRRSSGGGAGRGRGGAVVNAGPVARSPPRPASSGGYRVPHTPQLSPGEAAAYARTIRPLGQSLPPHSGIHGAHESHKYALHQRRDSAVSEGEYSFRNVPGEMQDQLRESHRRDAQPREPPRVPPPRHLGLGGGIGGGLDEEFKQFEEEEEGWEGDAHAQGQGQGHVRAQAPAPGFGQAFSPRNGSAGARAFFIPATLPRAGAGGGASANARQHHQPPSQQQYQQQRREEDSESEGAQEAAESARQRAAQESLRQRIAAHEHEQAQRQQEALAARQSRSRMGLPAREWADRFELHAGLHPSVLAPQQQHDVSASFRAHHSAAAAAAAGGELNASASSRGAVDNSISSVLQLAHTPLVQAFQSQSLNANGRVPLATVAAVAAAAAAAAIEATVGPGSPLRQSRSRSRPQSAHPSPVHAHAHVRSSPPRGSPHRHVHGADASFGPGAGAVPFSPSRSVGAPFRPSHSPSRGGVGGAARVSDLSDISSSVSQLSSSTPVLRPASDAAAAASQEKLEWYAAELRRLQQRQAEREQARADDLAQAQQDQLAQQQLRQQQRERQEQLERLQQLQQDQRRQEQRQEEERQMQQQQQQQQEQQLQQQQRQQQQQQQQQQGVPPFDPSLAHFAHASSDASLAGAASARARVSMESRARERAAAEAEYQDKMRASRLAAEQRLRDLTNAAMASAQRAQPHAAPAPAGSSSGSTVPSGSGAAPIRPSSSFAPPGSFAPPTPHPAHSLNSTYLSQISSLGASGAGGHFAASASLGATPSFALPPTHTGAGVGANSSGTFFEGADTPASLLSEASSGASTPTPRRMLAQAEATSRGFTAPRPGHIPIGGLGGLGMDSQRWAGAGAGVGVGSMSDVTVESGEDSDIDETRARSRSNRSHSGTSVPVSFGPTPPAMAAAAAAAAASAAVAHFSDEDDGDALDVDASLSSLSTEQERDMDRASEEQYFTSSTSVKRTYAVTVTVDSHPEFEQKQ